MNRYFPTAIAALAASLAGCASAAQPTTTILFVGNSYTFGRVAPALQYNAAAVTDLTAAFNEKDPTGGNSHPVGTGSPAAPCVATDVGCFEPHPWGGVPGIFKKLADQRGLDYDVSLSTRNASTMRGHFLNTANAAWDLRGNIASRKWDVVVLQGQSDEPLPPATAKNGNPASFKAYVDRIERYIHSGLGGATSEAEIFGGLAKCTAARTASPAGPGLSPAACTAGRTIPANVNANPAAAIYLYQTWARPDMVEPHKCTMADRSTLDGAPRIDPTCMNGANGDPATGQSNLFYTGKATTADNLRDMTNDLRRVFEDTAAANKGLTGIARVGDAFQRAVDAKVVKSGSFYNAAGTFDAGGSLMDLWWIDRTHASVHGSYLAALVIFGTITGLDPAAFGDSETSARELGISPGDAATLQRIAQETLKANGFTLR
jgi:hypothetical protein